VQLFGSDAQVSRSGTVSGGTSLPPVTFFAPAFGSAPQASFFTQLAGNNQFFGLTSPQVPPRVYDGRAVATLPETMRIRKSPIYPGSEVSVALESRAENAVDGRIAPRNPTAVQLDPLGYAIPRVDLDPAIRLI